MPDICVKIPERCFISSNPKKDFPFPFSFTVTYGYIPCKNTACSCASDADRIRPARQEPGNTAVKYPQITISGFDKLLPEPEEIERFINDLKKSGDSDWIIHKASSETDIVIRYTGLELSPDFYFCASTEKFIAGTKENDVVTLTVTVENFDNVENSSYEITTKVDYAPWAKSITFAKSPVELGSQVEVAYEYLGDKVDKELTQNGMEVDKARSPYTAFVDKPVLFKLRVCNDCGITDTTSACLDVQPPEIKSFTADKNYFSQGDSVALQWELISVSNVTIDHIDKEKDQVKETSAVVYPTVSAGTRMVEYTLRANGYEAGAPASVSRSLTLTQTLWKKTGSAKGYFSGEAYGNLKYNSRIFREEGFYYCYAHPWLYKSSDGLSWEQYSSNDKASGQFHCIAADYYDHAVYAMGKEGADGNRLYVSRYDFGSSGWEYSLANQSCCADIGSFAFSRTVRAYAQILEKGIMIARCGEDGKWCHGGSVIVAPDNKKVTGGDYCFYKNAFFAVMLCTDNYVYVYNCGESMEDILFKKKVDKDDQFVSLIPTMNHLYVVTSGSLIDVKTGEAEDDFSPMGGEKNKRMWLGSSEDDRLMGIYPDKNLWMLG